MTDDEREPGTGPGLPAEELARLFADFPSFCALLRVPSLKVSTSEARGLIPMQLTPLQRAYCARRTSRDIILKPRRVYITTLEVAYDLWWFFTVRGARVIVTCQTSDDHGIRDELAEMIRVMLESLREHIDIRLDVENNLRLGWHARDARLRIVEAGATLETARGRGRGITVNRLHATELAAWRHGIETMTVLLNAMPQDARYGSVTIESTPRGAAGYYFERWQAAVEGRGNFTAQFFPWYEHEEYRTALSEGEVIQAADEAERHLLARGVPPEALKWRRLQVADQGADQIAQEYPNDPTSCFLLSGRCFFDARLCNAQLLQCAPPIAVEQRGMLRIWEKPRKGSAYVIGADTAEGGGGDPSAALVFERGTGAHVASLHGQFIPWDFAQALVSLSTYYNGAVIAPERNNHGHAVIQAVQRGYGAGRRLYVHRDGKPGWLTNELTRSPMLDALDASHRRGTFRTPDRTLVEQMSRFVVSDDGKAEATKGSHDDLVMAGAIGWAVLTRPLVRRDFSALVPTL